MGILTMLADPEVNPIDATIYLDNLSDDLDSVHAIILLLWAMGVCQGTEMSTVDIAQTLLPFRDRPDETVPYDTTN